MDYGSGTTDLKASLEKLIAVYEKVIKALEKFEEVCNWAGKILAVLHLEALKRALEETVDSYRKQLEELDNTISKAHITGDSLQLARALRTFLRDHHVKAFAAIGIDADDFTHKLPSWDYQLEGPAYSAYLGYVKTQVGAASDMASASLTLSNMMDNAIYITIGFAISLGIALVMLVVAIWKIIAAIVAAPEAAPLTVPAIALKALAAAGAFIVAALGAAYTAWSSTASSIASINEIKLLTNGEWPKSTLDYKEG